MSKKMLIAGPILTVALLGGCGNGVEDVPSEALASSVPVTTSPPTQAAGPWTGIAGEEVTPSTECSSAMAEAAAESDSSAAEPLLENTLNVCNSVDEWLSAVKAQPAAMGITQGTPIGQIEVQSACFKYQSAPVCSDAQTRGVRF